MSLSPRPPRLCVSHLGPAVSPASLISEPNSLTVYSLNTCAAPSSRKHSAFSLIEVVLAIGVVAFALVGIFGLFSASLKTNKDSSAQQEGLEVAEVLRGRLQDTNFLPTSALETLQSALYGGMPTNYYLYTSNSALILTNSSTGYGLTNGLLYYVQILQSTNLNSMTNVFPLAAVSPSSADWPNWPGLPVSVRVYQMPSPNMSVLTLTKSNIPVLTFDMVIPR